MRRKLRRRGKGEKEKEYVVLLFPSSFFLWDIGYVDGKNIGAVWGARGARWSCAGLVVCPLALYASED